jgi:hypothetical protein
MPRRKETKPARDVQYFESFEAFVSQASQEAENTTSSRGVGRRDFYGTETFEDALEVAKRGWPEGAAKAQEILGELGDVIESIVGNRAAGYGYDVSGEYCDVGLFLSGEPECFGVEIEQGPIERPFVKIVANLGASGSVSGTSLIARGVAIVAAVDILESLGRRVELWAAKATEPHSGRLSEYELYVPLKSADQPLDIDRVSFAIAHPSFLRRLVFSVNEQRGLLPSRTCPTHLTDARNEPDTIVTEHCRQSTDFTREGLILFIAEILKNAGLEVPQGEIEELCSSRD